MKKLLFVFLFFSPQMFGQTTFQKTFGGTNDDNAWDIYMTNDSGYIMVGSTLSFGGAIDVYLIKVNAAGNLLWTKTYGGPFVDGGGTVREATDRGFIISGSSDSYSSGNYDAYLIKTDSVGNVVWKKLYGGANIDVANSVEQTGDGGYILAGYTYSNSFGINDVFLIKTDANGDTLWTRTYGGILGDPVFCVHHTVDGGYILAGWSQSYGLGNNGQACLLKIDANADTVWTKTYGGPFTDAFNHVLETPDNGYLATGYTNSSSGGGSDIFVVRTNTLGDTLWMKTYGTPFREEQSEKIEFTSDGGYVITGTQGGFSGDPINDIFLLKIDSMGNIIWSELYGDTLEDEGHSVLETSDKGFIVTGSTKSFGSGGKDVYLIKTDSMGISGCYQTNSNIVAGTKTITVESQAPLISSGTIVLNPNISLSSGGVLTALCPTTPSVKETDVSNFDIIIYPNPFTDAVTITSQQEITAIEVYNMLGELVFSTSNIKHQTSNIIDLSSQPSGIYFVRVTTKEGTVSRKIVRE